MCETNDQVYALEESPLLQEIVRKTYQPEPTVYGPHGRNSGHPDDCFGCKIRTLTFGSVSRDKVEEAVMPDGHKVKATTGTDGTIHIEYHDKEQIVVPNRKEKG